MTSISSVMVICATPVWGVLTEVGMEWVERMVVMGAESYTKHTLGFRGFPGSPGPPEDMGH